MVAEADTRELIGQGLEVHEHGGHQGGARRCGTPLEAGDFGGPSGGVDHQKR